MALRLAELAVALLAVGLLVGCTRGGSDGQAPAGGPDTTATMATPSTPAPDGPVGSTRSADTSVAAAPATTGRGATPARPVGCASVEEVDELLGGALLAEAAASVTPGSGATGSVATGSAVTDRVVALLSEVRRLAGDTVDPRGADARLLGLVPDARREGADLVRDGDALARLATALGATVVAGGSGPPGLAAGPGAQGSPPDGGPELIDVVAAVQAASIAERSVGGRLAAVDRIDDLVVAADAVGTTPETAASQRAVVVRWATTACAPQGSG